MVKKPTKKQDAEEVKTTGHEWDGIQEYNNPMPRWWVWTFYITIVWAIAYTIAYPAWPLVKGATQGVLGWDTRTDVANEIQRFTDMNATLDAELASIELTTVELGSDLHNFAIQSGRATYMAFCSQCHGAGAAGFVGYPNLLDDDWLWGGDKEAIHFTIAHGIRTDEDFDSRFSEMPAYGRDEILTQEEISQVTNYIMALSGTPQDASMVSAGAIIYADNCAACHMDDATGDRELGAPNLADAIWLFGSDYADIRYSVDQSRFGVMPNWNTRLTESQLAAVTLYVHQLGGGE